MKRTFFVAALTAALTAVLLLPIAGAAEPPRDSQKVLLDLQRQWAEARKHADLKFLESFYASEFTVGLMNGGEASRAADLQMFSSGDLKPTAIEDSDMKVHLYSETAMVTGTEHLEGSYQGHAGQFDLTFTNVYVYRDGRWQIVRHQAAQIRKP